MLTTFEKFLPLPKAQVLLTILRIFAVAVAFERFDTFDENRQNFRRARTASARASLLPISRLIYAYIGLTLAATPSAQMKMYMPCVAVCGLLTQTHAEL